MKTIFFDLNGVLITSEYLSYRFEEKYKVKSSIFIQALKEVMSVVRMPKAPNMHSLFNKYFVEWNLDISETEFLDFWFSGETVDIEALNYIKKLRNDGYMIYVVSNNFNERTTFYRENFSEIFENLDGAYFSWETGYVKPDKSALENILKLEKINTEDVIFFDDSKDNIGMAQELGIDAQVWKGLESAEEYILNKSV